MKVLAIDPGTEQSAYINYIDGMPHGFGILPNEELSNLVKHLASGVEMNLMEHLAIEWVSFYGKEIHAGSETFHTCRWVGRFQEAWDNEASCSLIERRAVRSSLCGTQKAGDAEVRAVLIDRYGGKEKAIGRKAAPGPLYGITSHVWSALAVAVTFEELDAARRIA